jgi:membrane protein YqaA with SNARE-associated domain
VALALFAYAFVSNVAMSVVPHEPVVIWYGAHWGIVSRVATQPVLASGFVGKIRRLFYRAPFAVIAVSGLTPLPAWPVKAAAFAERYPMGPYLAAVAAGRFPRYVLLAWLGFVVSVPNWVLVALVLVMFLPSLKAWIWKRPSAR